MSGKDVHKAEAERLLGPAWHQPDSRLLRDHVSSDPAVVAAIREADHLRAEAIEAVAAYLGGVANINIVADAAMGRITK